jgi:hypothetical protein
MDPLTIASLVTMLLKFGVEEYPIIQALFETKKALQQPGRPDVDRAVLQAIDDAIETLQKSIEAKAHAAGIATGAPMQLGPKS